jgi:hypothetical protein
MYWRLISPREWQAIAIGIGILMVVAFVFLWLNPRLKSTNSGFGPEPACTSQALSEPTCLKKVP